MKKYAVAASYSQTALGFAEFPEGKTWDDVKDWYIKWDCIHVQFEVGGEYLDISLNSSPDGETDWKRPGCVSIHAVNENGEVDYNKEIAEAT